MKKNHYILFVIMVFVFSSVSCSSDEEQKPWSGYEVKEMRGGTRMYPLNIILNAKAGEIHWFYIQAEKNKFYEIGMYGSGILQNWMENDKNRAPNHGVAVMSGYKEDGTLFARMDPNKEGNYLNTPINYYSPVNQKLYICFEITFAGYLLFYKNTTSP